MSPSPRVLRTYDTSNRPSGPSAPARPQTSSNDPYAEGGRKQRVELPETATSLPDPKPSAPEGQTTTTTTTTGGQQVDLSNMSHEQAFQYGVGYAATMGQAPQGVDSGMNIRRPGYTKVPTISVSSVDMEALGAAPYARSSNYATPEEYSADWYTTVLRTDTQRAWWARMAIGLGWAKYDPDSPFGVSEADFERNVRGLYEWAGEAVRMDPTLNKMTPEEWVESLYNTNGGADRYASSQESNEPPPVITTTSTSTVTISREAAFNYADQVAMSVLGRMATKSEMRRARAAMNKMLANSPTVSTQVVDRTDPANITQTVSTESGASAADAAEAYERKMRRSSEGMAFNVGTGFENALASLDRGL